MKKQIIALTAVVALLLSSCGMLKGNSTSAQSSTTTSSASAATTDAAQMGKNAGSALDYLAAQYKSAGKLDMTNMMNIANMLNLVGAAQQVYQNKSDKTYRQGFVKGLIANSINIDQYNADSVTDKLQSLAENTNVDKLSSAMQKGQATASEVENVASSVTNIIKLFK
ncbi:MAG: hypothetical protein IJS13_00175 [Paludibacteraceae bacterium]|nr:hypothetical protein [Paludibacteraceae bacterium]